MYKLRLVAIEAIGHLNEHAYQVILFEWQQGKVAHRAVLRLKNEVCMGRYGLRNIVLLFDGVYLLNGNFHEVGNFYYGKLATF